MIENLLKNIEPLDTLYMEEAKIRLDSLTKPLGSLGKLEELVIKLAGIQKKKYPQIDKRAIVIMCADNGVVEEGISSCPKEVTSTVTKNFLKGITGVNIFSNYVDSDIVVVDVGVDDDIENVTGIIHKKIRRGTGNIAKEAAMTKDELIRAIGIGIETVKDFKEKGYNLIGTGEMGIGNTTTSSAVLSCLCDIEPEEVVGKGSGLSKEGLLNKIEVVKRAIKINKPTNEPLDILQKLGGLDIAGLVGVFLGGAIYRVPIVIDGFISSVAALAAVKIDNRVRDFIFPSHISKEPGAKIALEAIGFEGMLNLDMRLGEGTGAALSFFLFDVAIESYTKMGTFDDANIEKYVPLD